MPKADPVATATLASGGKAALASRLVAATRRASLATATGAVIDYQYDTLRRLTRSKVALNGSTVYTTAYAFRDLDASRTTTQVQYRNVRSANGEVLEGKKYTYDALGNITRISQSTKPFYTLVAYEYDAQNQLVKETYYNGKGSAAGNISRTIAYTYDTAGNILSETKTVNDKTTTKTFSYTDSNWKDLLTAVNGLSITYDASGNPETYYTGSVDRRGNAEVYYMYWGNGRQLTDVETDDGQTRSRISYGYDADGIRSWKAVDGEIHTYLTQGGKVMRETVGSTVMDFAYDESGRPFAMTYQSANEDPQTYYYVLNLQGDVVKLVTASGTEAASYAYDAWGNLLSATGSMAYTNPLRYRGYYHDAETRFYYLQSRYYDPVYHRFINADSYASTNATNATACNMFAYCYNNPVIYRDSNGTDPVETIDIDGDGVVDCHVYEYNYSGYITGIMGTSASVPVSGSGKLYIYKGVSEDYLADPANKPAGFRDGVDFMVGDFIAASAEDPNIQVRDSYLCTVEPQMKAITAVLLEYAAGTEWKRTQKSLIKEWKEHNRYAIFSDRARHVDFNNAEEGKGFFYFLGKAIKNALKSVTK